MIASKIRVSAHEIHIRLQNKRVKSCPINRSGDVQITDPASRAKYCLVWLLALYLLLQLLSLPWPLSAAWFFSSGVVDAFCLGDLVLRIYVYIHVCMYIYICMYVCMYIYIYVTWPTGSVGRGAQGQ